MKDSWAGRWLDALALKGLCFPLELTQRSGNPLVRLLGLGWQFAWTAPAMVVLMVPIIVLFFASLVIEAWRGEL